MICYSRKEISQIRKNGAKTNIEIRERRKEYMQIQHTYNNSNYDLALIINFHSKSNTQR